MSSADISLVVATHSADKIKEIKALLGDLPLSLQLIEDFNVHEPEETGATFEENALIKALACARYTGLLSLSDDSGFCIPALKGLPGVYSKRWAEGDYNQAFQRLYQQIREKDLVLPVPAFFQTVLVLAWPDGSHRAYSGRIEGNFVMPPRAMEGRNYGYDPVFEPLDQPYFPFKTFGEMTVEEKNQFSHRSRAIAALKQDFPWTR
jgi:XTP/dITP diphosphohydrolase